jgi:hypothetical protein
MESGHSPNAATDSVCLQGPAVCLCCVPRRLVPSVYLFAGERAVRIAGMAKKQPVSISGHGAKFGPKMDQAVIALMSKPSIEAAAQAVGVHANTLLRWSKDPKFQEAYEQARTGAFSQSIARLQKVSGSAVETLLEIMKDKKQPAGIRVRCADIVLGHAGGGDGLAARAAHVKQLAKSNRSAGEHLRRA